MAASLPRPKRPKPIPLAHAPTRQRIFRSDRSGLPFRPQQQYRHIRSPGPSRAAYPGRRPYRENRLGRDRRGERTQRTGNSRKVGCFVNRRNQCDRIFFVQHRIRSSAWTRQRSNSTCRAKSLQPTFDVNDLVVFEKQRSDLKFGRRTARRKLEAPAEEPGGHNCLTASLQIQPWLPQRQTLFGHQPYGCSVVGRPSRNKNRQKTRSRFILRNMNQVARDTLYFLKTIVQRSDEITHIQLFDPLPSDGGGHFGTMHQASASHGNRFLSRQSVLTIYFIGIPRKTHYFQHVPPPPFGTFKLSSTVSTKTSARLYFAIFAFCHICGPFQPESANYRRVEWTNTQIWHLFFRLWK